MTAHRPLRILLLFAPMLIVLGVSLALILAVLRAPSILVGLASATIITCIVVVATAVLFQLVRARKSDLYLDDRIVRLVDRIAADPDHAETRGELLRHMQRLDEISLAADQLTEQGRNTVRHVLIELGAREGVQWRAKGGSPWERVTAARHLAWLRPDDVVSRLDSLARDANADVALAGTVGLAAIPEQAAYEALLRLIDEGPLPASRTATLIEESTWDDPVPTLLRMVPQGKAPLRLWGAYLAGQTRDARLLPLLSELAADADPDIRANAAEALASMPDHRTLETLHQLSRDDIWFVRARAARALGEAGEAAVRRLVEMLVDDQWWVRENAARAIARIGEPAIPLLREALLSEDRFARNKAAEVLVGLGFIEHEMEAFLNETARQEEARENLVRLGRAEALNSLSSRFLAVADRGRRRILARLCREIDESGLMATIRGLDDGLAPAVEAHPHHTESSR